MDHVLDSAGGMFTDRTDSQPTDVPRILDLAMREAPGNGLVLHFHGGLVSKSEALASAQRLQGAYEEAGAYPVFFVWESGLLETLLHHQQDLAKDPAWREFVKKVTEWLLIKLGEGAVLRDRREPVPGQPHGQRLDVRKLRAEFDAWFASSRAAPPVADAQLADARMPAAALAEPDVDELAGQILAGLDDDPGFRRAIEEAFNAQLPASALATRGQGTKTRAPVMLLSRAARAQIFPRGAQARMRGGTLSWRAVATFVAKVVIAVLRRYRTGRDHGAYCTVVEEVLRAAYGDLIGSAVWNQMKQDTQISFQTGRQYCGTDVLAYLKTLERSAKAFSHITVVGHSAGALYVCNFLDAAKQVGLATRIKVALLAPAVRHDRFASALAAHEGTTRLSAFRLFAMQDAIECEDRMLGIIYTRSLLYFVSGLTEGKPGGQSWQDEPDTPIVGMQRYLVDSAYAGSSFEAVRAVAGFLARDATRAVWSPAQGPPGLQSQARHHGGFCDDPQTVASVQEFLQV